MRRARRWVDVARASRDGDVRTKLPIVQAPMAGVGNFELVDAATASGIHGSLACGFLSKEGIRREFSSIRFPKKVVANVFAIDADEHERAFSLSREAFHLAIRDLRPIADAMEVRLPDRVEDLPYPPSLETQLEELLSIKPWALSFTFNRLDKKYVRAFQDEGVQVIGTATCLKEAQLLCDVDKVDAVVAQGSEAGGHRGAFWPQPNGSRGDLIGTTALVRSFRRNLDESTVVYAAGGIVDAESVVSSCVLGADAVMMGSAFLVTNECKGASDAHKRAASNAHARTVVSNAFSGRFARGLANHLVGSSALRYSPYLQYPFQQYLVNHMASFGASRGEKKQHGFSTMWCGQGDTSSSYGSSCDAFVRKLDRDVCRILASDSWSSF